MRYDMNIQHVRPFIYNHIYSKYMSDFIISLREIYCIETVNFTINPFMIYIDYKPGTDTPTAQYITERVFTSKLRDYILDNKQGIIEEVTRLFTLFDIIDKEDPEEFFKLVVKNTLQLYNINFFTYPQDKLKAVISM